MEGEDSVLGDLGLASFVLRRDDGSAGLPPGFRDTTGGLVCAGNATRTDGVLVVHGAGLGVVDSLKSGQPLGAVTAADAARLHLQCFNCDSPIRAAPQFVKERSGRVNTIPFCTTRCRLSYVMYLRGADPGLLHNVFTDVAAYGVRPGSIAPAEPPYMLRQYGGVYTSRDLRTRRGAGPEGRTVGTSVTHRTMPHVMARIVSSAPKQTRSAGVFRLDAADTEQMFPENNGVAHGLRRLEVDESKLSHPVRLAEGPMMAFYITRRQRALRWVRSNPDVARLMDAAKSLARGPPGAALPGDGEHKASSEPPAQSGPAGAWPEEPLFEPGRVIEAARAPGGVEALRAAMPDVSEAGVRAAVDKLADYHAKMEREIVRDFPSIASVMDPTGIAARRADKAQKSKSASVRRASGAAAAKRP